MFENIIKDLATAGIGTFFGAYFAFALQAHAERKKQRLAIQRRLVLILEDMRKAERLQQENIKRIEWFLTQSVDGHGIIPTGLISLPTTYFAGIDYVELLRFTDKNLVDHLRNVQTYLFPNWAMILSHELKMNSATLDACAKVTLSDCQKVIAALEQHIAKVKTIDDFQEPDEIA